MPRDPLVATSVVAGVTAAEIVAIANENIGISWTIDGCTDFVWGVANLSGAWFFDSRNNTTSNDPTRPQDIPYVVPHSPGIASGTDNVGGDGWAPVFNGTSASAMKAALRAGDVVRVYAAGNAAESSFLPGGGYGAHSFIVTDVSGSTVTVVDNWNSSSIVSHDLQDIIDAFAPAGSFQSAFVSRIDQSYVDSNFGSTVSGNGYGDFSGLGSGGSIGPDLVGVIIAIDQFIPGETSQVTVRVTNEGDESASSALAELALWNAGETTVIAPTLQEQHATIAAGNSRDLVFDFAIPSGLQAGEYNFRVEVGRLGNEPTENTGNNFSSFFEVIYATGGPGPTYDPDLVVQNVRLDDTSIAEGGETTIRYDVVELNGEDAGSTRTGIYISSTTNFSDASLLDADNVSVSANEADAESEVLQDLSGYSPGTYYLFVQADMDGDVSESNEGNNVSGPITLTINGNSPPPPSEPDLVITDLTLGSTTWADGDTIAAVWTLENIGGSDAISSDSALYISTDSNITTSDIQLEVDTGSGTMNPGEVNPEGETDFTLDLATLGLGAGTYYVGAIADILDEVSESDEANNVSPIRTVTIQGTTPPPSGDPDLVITDLALGSTTWADGDTIAVEWTLENTGGADALSSDSALYISSDSNITTSDIQLNVDTGSGTMNPGEVNPEGGPDFTLDLATLGLGAGTYYVGAIADILDEVSESDEANNVSSAVQVTVQEPNGSSPDTETTTGHFQNDYTFTIVDHPGGYDSELVLIEENAVAVIEYLSDHISWNGILDFVVRFGDPFQNGAGGSGLLPSYGGIAANGHTFAAHEALSGVDENGDDGDAGLWLLPNADGTLTNFGIPLFFDPTPDLAGTYSPPEGTHDFFSIFLHEVLHSLGFWSIAQHGPVFGQSVFDTLTTEVSGSHYFTGSTVTSLLGQDLRLAATGSRDHYGGVDIHLANFPFVDRGAMFEFGNYEQNRWHLGQLDLAVLEDLGLTIANSERLAVVELPDLDPNLIGNSSQNRLFGDHQANMLTGLAGNDTLVGNQGNDTLNGGAGNDTMDGGSGDDRFFVDSVGDVVVEAQGEGRDTVTTSVTYVLPDNVEVGSMSGSGDIGLTGSAQANTITGNAGDNEILGMEGADRLRGRAGNDTLTGGADNDILEGGDGENLFVMGPDNGDDQVLDWSAGVNRLDFDSLLGLRFTDLEITSSGNEALITFDDSSGGTGSVRLIGIDPESLEIAILSDPDGPGDVPLIAGTSAGENLAGTAAAEDLVGLAGNDSLNGRAGDDMMLGGFGNDRYFLDDAGDVAVEHEFQGIDQVDTRFSMVLPDHIERGAVRGGGAVDITGNDLDNFITGSDLQNVLIGGGGRDRLIARAGNDTLDGGLDRDVLEGGDGLDVFVFGPDSDVDLITDFVVGEDLLDVTALGIAFADMTIVDGPLGALVIFDNSPGSVDLVQLQGVAAADVRLASFIGAPNLPIVGTDGNDVLFGTAEDDELQGLDGADRVNGLAGADVMIGGLGDDRYFVDDAGDVVTELPGEGTDQVTTSIDFTLAVNVENANTNTADPVNLTGNDLGNLLNGNDAANTLTGLDGDDNLQGNAGIDLIIGGTGADLLRGGTEADTFVFATGDGQESGDTIIDFEVGVDTIDLSATGLTYGDLTIQDVGANATIAYGTDLITVLNTTASQLSEDHFEFGEAMPDLIVEDLLFSTTDWSTGSVISVDARISNTGTASALGPSALVFISDDDLVTLEDDPLELYGAAFPDGSGGTTLRFPFDVLLNDGPVPLGPGYSISMSTGGAVGNLAPGNYYVSAFVDAGTSFDELNENNNWSNVVEISVI